MSPVDDDDGTSITFRIKCSILGRCSDVRSVLIVQFACDVYLAAKHLSTSIRLFVHRRLRSQTLLFPAFLFPRIFAQCFVSFDGINSQISKIIQDIIHGSEFDVDSCWLHKTFWIQHFTAFYTVHCNDVSATNEKWCMKDKYLINKKFCRFHWNYLVSWYASLDTCIESIFVFFAVICMRPLCRVLWENTLKYHTQPITAVRENSSSHNFYQHIHYAPSELTVDTAIIERFKDIWNYQYELNMILK